MHRWQQKSLGEFIELKRGYDLPSRDRVPGEFPLVTSSGPTECISQSKAKGPGVVTGRYGTVGQVFYVQKDFWPLNTALYVRDFRGNSPRFVYYFLHGIDWEKFNDKSGVPGINRNDVHREPVFVPPLDQQKQIVSVLGGLDDKIELNRRMNETLEAMAQAIFRDWFVDFGPVRRKLAGVTNPVAIMGGLMPDPARAADLARLFPDALNDEGLPERWGEMRVDQIADQSTGAVNPQNLPDVVFEHYSLPAYDTGQEPARDLGATIKSNKVRILEGSILVSKLNPETPRVWLPNEDSGLLRVASTEFLMFTPKSGLGRGFLYFMFQDASVRQIMEGMVTGTSKSHQRISPPALLKTKLIVGTVNMFVAFDALVAPILLRLLALRAENRTLAETRDYLLPRLMSGAVRVGEALEKVEDAA
jgi:type I restriction enzyme S subunit